MTKIATAMDYELAKLYNGDPDKGVRGLSLSEIADIFKTHPNTIRDRLQKLGVELRPRGGAHNTTLELDKLRSKGIDIDGILSDTKTTLEQKAVKLHVHPQTIRNYLKRQKGGRG